MGIIGDKLAEITQDPKRHKFSRYLLAGGVSSAFGYAIFVLCYKGFGIWYVYATMIAGTCAWFVNFPLQRWWAFKDTRNTKVAGVQAGGHVSLKMFNAYVWDPLLLYYFAERWGVDPLFGKFGVGAILMGQNFVLYKYVIFNPGLKRSFRRHRARIRYWTRFG